MRLFRLYGKNEPSSQKMKVFQGLKSGKDFVHLSSELDIKKGTAEVYGINCLAAGGSVDHEMIARYLELTPDAFHRIKSSLRSSRFRFLQAKRGKRARALGEKEQKSRSGGEGRGRKGNACR